MFFVIKYVELLARVWVGYCAVPHVGLQMKELTTDPTYDKYLMQIACYLLHLFVNIRKSKYIN